jgi:GH15 family glucan-1,4-alpha-glucosidase
MTSRRYPPIEDYGVIGDLHTVALVGRNGSIDFLCFPRFDSPSVFAALLDADKGGRFVIEPVLTDARHRQLYLPDTNVLLTRFLATDGVAEITDFMPVEEVGMAHNLIRQVRAVRGELCFRMLCAPRFDYARASHRVEQTQGETVFVSEGSDRSVLRLRHSVPVRVENGDARAEFTLAAGETAELVLEYVTEDGRSAPATPEYVEACRRRTQAFWHEWISHSRYQGRWREIVNRSALALKLMMSRELGAFIAAPTFGLPETIGGVRNWDYRYTWIRDTAFALYALMRLGFTEEAGRFMDWVQHRCAELEPDGSLQVMYRIDGGHDLTERTLDHLEGYRGSAPVRIGNAAYCQLQLDIYGELLDSIYLANKYGDPIHHALWENVVRIVDWVCDHWREPDEGIWEMRSGRREYTHSRLMCWVAVDRALRIAEHRSFPAPRSRWYPVRDEIYRTLFTEHWCPELRAFVQHKGSRTLDASLLLMPLVKLVAPTDPQWLSTLDAITEHLVDDALVHRYHTPDGLDGEEGTFSMCSFWYVECLARAGRIDQARLTFEKMLGYANHLGLYGEELGLRAEHLGNFPQAFTHMALISAAWNLDAALEVSGRRRRT